jgi:hypothetical protein
MIPLSIICVQLKTVSNLCKPTKYEKKTNLTSQTLLPVDYINDTLAAIQSLTTVIS